ncbi:MAG: SpoIIE family protein phosphatase [Planctomycetota bacterium]
MTEPKAGNSANSKRQSIGSAVARDNNDAGAREAAAAKSPHPRDSGRASARPRFSADANVRHGMRIPIAIKYAVFTGVLFVVFLLYTGSTWYQSASRDIDEQINEKGIALAATIACKIEEERPHWVAHAPTTAEYRIGEQRLEKYLVAVLKDPGSSGLIDILVYSTSRKESYANASGTREFQLQGDPVTSAPAEVAGVKVFGGTMAKEGGRARATRSYERELKCDGGVVGFVRVFLSADKIEEVRQQVKSNVLWAVALALLVGFPLVMLVARYLTGPVRHLKRDMEIVAGGDRLHQSSVQSGDELESLAHTFNRMTSRLAEAREQEAGLHALERELAIATSIQTALLPSRIPTVEGYELFPYYASAKEVGGDYYDFIPTRTGRFALIVADVSGKGIPGSLVMTMTRSLVRMAARMADDPIGILNLVNTNLSRDMTRGMFVTMVFADCEPTSGQVRIARAGHNPALLYRRAEDKVVAVQPQGIALGMDPGPLFAKSLEVQTHTLARGDFLVLYTDGIIEAMNAEAEEYTEARFRKQLATHANSGAREIVEHVLRDVAAHTKGCEASDDITLIILKRG